MSDGPISDLVLPHDLTGASVERDQVGVVCGKDELVAVECRVTVGARQVRRVLDALAPVFPQDGAVRGVHGLDEVACLGKKHDAIVHERGRLLQARLHGPRPCQTEAAHVGRIDLVERAVPPVVVGTAPHEPLAVRRVEQHVLRHGCVVIQE